MRLFERIIMDLVYKGIPFEFSPMGTMVKGIEVKFEINFRFVGDGLGVCYRMNPEENWKLLSWEHYKELIKEEDYLVL